jgi:tRNA(Arg) A34 adenosine deaminase TadA
MCLGAILWARLEALHFGSTAADAAAAGFDDSAFYDEVRRDVPDRRLRTVNLLRDEAGESFRAWREFRDRVEY